MRPQDKPHFLSAAASKYWILVRRTNRKSLFYVGKEKYVPKRIDCKAKTADQDRGRYELAGLVVSPVIHPGAFSGKKTGKALEFWNHMLPLKPEYTVDTDPNSKHYGCLMLNNHYIHGDYDLKGIIDIKKPNRNQVCYGELYGTPHNSGPYFEEIKNHVNSRIGVNMIQHDAEDQYADHSEEPIDAFGPNGEDVTILNEYSIRAWYDERFEGRQTFRTKK